MCRDYFPGFQLKEAQTIRLRESSIVWRDNASQNRQCWSILASDVIQYEIASYVHIPCDYDSVSDMKGTDGFNGWRLLALKISLNLSLFFCFSCS